MTSRLVCLIALYCTVFQLGCNRDTRSTPAPDAKASATNRTKVKLQLNWKPEPQFGGFYAAAVTNTYTDHDLDVEITPGGPGTPTVDMLGAGTVPFAVVSADEIVIARAHGNKLVALLAVYQTNPQGIMTRASRGFTKLDDVFANPGTLAIERGLPYAGFLERKYGLGKLKIVPSPFGDLSLFRTDPTYSMQCFVTSEPLAAKQAGTEPKTFLVADSGYNPYTTVLATSEAFYKENSPTIAAMRGAVRDGWRAYLDDPTATNAKMHELNPTMDLETFKASADVQKPLIETNETRANGLGYMTEARWQTLCDQLKDLKAVDNPPPAAECFEITPREEK